MRRMLLLALLPFLCFGLISCGTKSETKQEGEVKQVGDYNWEPQTQATGSSQPSFESVSALDANHVWAVGDKGTIQFFNGTSWSDQSIGTHTNLMGVSAFDANHVWAVGDEGTTLFGSPTK